MSKDQVRMFKSWQIRTLFITIAGYAMFYFVRKNLSIAMPFLREELGISPTQLGFVLTLHGVVYGISKFANGIWGDRANARIFFASGLAFAATANLFFGMGESLMWLGTFWILNAWFQGMGVPPCIKLMTHWIPPSQLAVKMSIWNTSHSIGAGAAVIFCGYIVAGNWSWTGVSPWRFCFFIPAVIALFGALMIWIVARDTPSSVGIPEMNLKVKDDSQNSGLQDSAEFAAFIRKHVFMNPVVWIISIGNFFVYVVRFAVLDWGPMMLHDHLKMDMSHAGWMVAGFEVAGIVGMLAAGWITEKVFKGRAVRTCVWCMFFSAVCMASLWSLDSQSSVLLAAIILVSAGFFIYGPQALAGIAAANIATNKAASTAVGLVGICGYASTVLSGLGLGVLVETAGWDWALFAFVCAAVVGCAVFALAWNAKATGYEE